MNKNRTKNSTSSTLLNKKNQKVHPQESELQFRQLAETIPHIVFISNSEGRVEFYNKKWYEYTGAPAHFDFSDWASYIHPEDIGAVRTTWEQAKKKGEIYEATYRLKRDDGIYRWFISRSSPFLDDTNTVTCWHGTATDIHDMKQAESNLSFLANASKVLSSSLDLATTLSNIASLAVPTIADWCAIDMVDSNGGLDRVAIAHIDPEKIKWAQHLAQQYPVDMNAPTGVPNVIKTGKAELYPIITDELLVASAKDEKQLKMLRNIGLTSVIIVPICIENNCIGAISFVNTETTRSYSPADLTMAEELASRASHAVQNARLYKSAENEIEERKKVEELLRYQKSLLEAQQDVSPLGILVVSPSGEMVMHNELFVTMWKMPKDVVESKLDEMALKAANEQLIDSETFTKKVLDCYEQKVKNHEKLFFKDGRIFERFGSPIIDSQNTYHGYIWFFLDITEREKLSQQKDDFIGIATHELKTPVTSIKAYTQILHDRFSKDGDEKSATMLGKMDAQLDKLINLISDLLDVTKIEAGKLSFNLETFDFNKLTHELVEELQRMTTKHTIHISGNVTRNVYADKDRTGQVLTNLVTNAIKYSPHSDRIDVILSEQKESVSLCVQDFGVGIAKEKQDKVFERFYRVSGPKEDTFPGLGLGLYISSEIIKRQGGKITVESSKGKGSTFCITLPFKSKKVVQQENTSLESEVQHGS